MIPFRRIAALCLAALTIDAALGGPVLAQSGGWTPYVAVSLGSQHLSDEDFEEFNPGLGLGADYGFEVGGWEAGAEGGAFRNSFGERSIYALGHLTAELVRLAPATELRAGFFAGLAEYDNLVEEADAAGLPHVGDFIPVGGALIQLRHAERWEARVRIAPLPGDGVVFGFQAAVRLPPD